MKILPLCVIVSWYALTVCPEVGGIVGYDCGSKTLNITTLSLLDVERCNIPLVEPQIIETYIQLLQLSKYESIKVIQCKVAVSRYIFYCGMHSHVSTVSKAQAEYISETSTDQCKQMHQFGTLSVDVNTVIHGLKVNKTMSRSLTFAGSVTSDGRCNGAQYSDPYGSWDSVIVQGVITITLNSYSTAINLETNQIHLRSGTICQYSDTTCVDVDGGYTFWTAIPTDYCMFNYYDILYEGYANKMLDDTNHEQPQVIYSLATHDVTFALTKVGEEPLCGYALIKTEHPKLLILETKKGDSFANKRQLSVENMDIFAYVNSKFVYVERHIRTQLNYLYRDVLMQRCSLEQQVLKNALSIAVQSPDEFAYQFMKGPGYMAVISGEVVHIIKCMPVEVKIRHTKECYSQLPVSKNKERYFLTPKTHILVKTGAQITCNRIIPAMYFLNDGWYRLTPTPEQALPPIVMKPMTKPTWHYTNPGSLAISGIYSNKDLEHLRDHIMFPAERPAILNTMARGITGESIISQGMSFSNLLDKDALQKIAQNTWKSIWENFTIFGNTSAGLIGIYICIRVLKLLIDTIIHGYALHRMYGWSIHLVGALWDSITNLMLHLSKRSEEEEGAGQGAGQRANLASPRQESADAGVPV